MSVAKSSIDWGTRFSLPVAMPLDEGDLPVDKFADYFSNAIIKARLMKYSNPAFSPDNPSHLRRIGSTKAFLLPRSSLAQSGSPVDIQEEKIRLVLRTSQYHGDLPDDINAAVEIESERIHVVFEDYRSNLLPLPFLTSNSIVVTWPPEETIPSTPLIASDFPGVAPTINGTITFQENPKYLLETRQDAKGELDSKWLRAFYPGLIRFQRYRHISEASGVLKGRNPSTSGRIVLWDPEPKNIIDDGSSENRLSRSITGLAYESVDAGYLFTANDIGLTADRTTLARSPAIAESYRNLLIFYLSHYNKLKNSQTDPTNASTQTKISPLLFGFISRSMARLFRTWLAYSKFILNPSWTPTLSPATLTELEDETPITDDVLEDIAGFLISDASHWTKIIDFIDLIFVPLYLGATWRELGVPPTTMPADINRNGWWRSNRWAWEALSSLENYNLNWLVVYSGAPLGHPAGFYKGIQLQNSSAADDETRLRNVEGLTAYEMESISFSGNAQAILGVSNISLPSSVSRSLDIGQFELLRIGYLAALRPYKIEVSADGGIQTIQILGGDLLAELFTNSSGQRPVIEIVSAFQLHPLVDPTLIAVSQQFSIRAIRQDGDFNKVEKGRVIEFGVTYGNIIGDTDPQKVNIKIGLISSVNNIEQKYIHFRDLSFAADANFQSSPGELQAEIIKLPSGWTVNEAAENYLSNHPFNYEQKLLILHDLDHTETTVFAWAVAVDRQDGNNSGSQKVRISLFNDATEIISGFSPNTLNLAVPAGLSKYPATFQDKVCSSVAIPPNGNITVTAGDTVAKRKAFLNSQLITSQSEGLNWLNTVKAYSVEDRDLINDSWMQEMADAGDTGLGDIFLKIRESDTDATEGIKPEFVKALCHQIIKIVYHAFEAHKQYLSSSPGLQFPMEVMWALYRLEGYLNVPPSFEMLQRGIPPIQTPEYLKILIFKNFTSEIKDLIVRVSAGVSTSSSKKAIDKVKEFSIILYHLNLVAMDIYVGTDEASFAAFSSRVARFGFLRTYLVTRKDLGLQITEQRIKEGLELWYRMIDQLVLCQKGVSFAVVREPVNITSQWLLEATLHLASKQKGKFLNSRVISNKLPPALCYLRFNFDEVSFWRIINIIMVITLDKIGTEPIRIFLEETNQDNVRIFLEDIRDNLTDDLNTAANPTTVTKLRQMSLFKSNISRIMSSRRKDNNDPSFLSHFEMIEEKLLKRVRLPNGDILTNLEIQATRDLIPGPNEKDILTKVNPQTGGLYKVIESLVDWLDSRDYWQALGDWFGTKELKDLLNGFIAGFAGAPEPEGEHWMRDYLFLFKQTRSYLHLVRGYEKVF